MHMSRLTEPANLTFNAFAWFDTVNFLFYQPSELILVVLIILFSAVLILMWFFLLKNKPLRVLRLSASYRGIRKKSKRFLLRFEWLKLHRQSILFYPTAIIVDRKSVV